MTQSERKNSTINTLLPRDAAAHDWYRFVLSYPPHVVGEYIERFGLLPSQWVLPRLEAVLLGFLNNKAESGHWH